MIRDAIFSGVESIALASDRRAATIFASSSLVIPDCVCGGILYSPLAFLRARTFAFRLRFSAGVAHRNISRAHCPNRDSRASSESPARHASSAADLMASAIGGRCTTPLRCAMLATRLYVHPTSAATSRYSRPSRSRASTFALVSLSSISATPISERPTCGGSPLHRSG